MKIDYIYAPFVFTDTGRRIPISELSGDPKVGAELSDTLEVLSNTTDENCVNGVCPIR